MEIINKIKNSAETVEETVTDFADAFRKKRWVKILSVGCASSAIILFPPTFNIGYKLLTSKTTTNEAPPYYFWVIWIGVTALFFVAALIAALSKKEAKIIESEPATSIIKGLLAYTNSEEDAKWFAKLQRGNILQECLQFCMAKDYSLGVISGESGTGKTSLMQAGLQPSLEKQNIDSYYIPFSDMSPLDSIKQHITENTDETSTEDTKTLLEMCQEKLRKGNRPIILILDQFEQFFVHHKTKTERKSFIKQVGELLNHKKTLPIKLLVSIRGDYFYLLNEFQNEIRYILTPHNNLSIKKFEPEVATKIFKVFAEEMKIEFDEEFVKKFVRYELADSEDGTVSPVDIQILVWMLDGQRHSDEHAFNQKSFDKLGRVSGLLERFLKRALKSRESDSRRQAAIHVMRALTEGEVRAGALKLSDIKKKLKGVISENDVEESIIWLIRSDVRLVTSIQEKNVTLFEIAHEKIIKPLHRLVEKEILEVTEAQNNLDFGVVEWMKNNQSRHYLLNRNDMKLITRNWNLLSLESKKEQKEDFVQKSKRYILLKSVGLISICAMLLFGVGFYLVRQWNAEKPEAQISNVENDLADVLDKTTNSTTTKIASLLIPLLPSETNQPLKDKIWKKIEGQSENDKFDILKSLTDIDTNILKNQIDSTFGEHFTSQINDTSEHRKIILQLRQANIYKKLTKEDEAKKIFDSINESFIRNANYVDKNQESIIEIIGVASDMFINYGKISDAKNALNIIRESANKNHIDKRKQLLETIAIDFGKLSEIDSAWEVFEEINYSPLMKDEDGYPKNSEDFPKKAKIFSAIADGCGKLINSKRTEKGLLELRKVEEKVKELETFEYGTSETNNIHLSLIKAYGELPKEVALTEIDRHFQSYKHYFSHDEFLEAADIFIKLDEFQKALSILERGKTSGSIKKLKSSAENLTNSSDDINKLKMIEQYAFRIEHPFEKADMLYFVVQSYIRLSKLGEARNLLNKIDEFVKTKNFDKELQLELKMFEFKTNLGLGRTEPAKNVSKQIKDLSPDLNFIQTAEKLLIVVFEISKIQGQDIMDVDNEVSSILVQLKNDYRKNVGDRDTPPDFAIDLVKITKILAELKKWKEAFEIVQLITDANYRVEALSKILITYYAPNSKDFAEKEFQRIEKKTLPYKSY